jgi:hypothetical protein
MALYLDTLGQIVVASSMPSGGSAVPAQPSSNLVDTAPWFRSRDDGSIQWHPANYYSGSGETSLLLTGMLTIPVSVVNSSTTGVVPVGGFANATGTFRVWLGTEDVTTLCTFTAGTPNNITASINSSTGVYSATAMPDAQSYGSIVFTASYKGQSLALTYAVTKAKDGVVGANGANFNINQSSAIFNKSASGVVSPNAGILLTTSYQNISAITGYVWKKGGSIINNVNTPIYTVPIDDYTFVTTNSYSCTITGTINGVVGATLTDNITIPMLIDGSSTPTVVLSNENMTFPASNLGFSGINFASGSCEVTAYIGTTQLTYSATGGANTFKCIVSATNVTVAGGTISGNKLILPAPTAMSADSAFLDITTTIYNSTGTALSGLLVSRVTYALSRAGINGVVGANGANFSIDQASAIFNKSSSGVVTPSGGIPLTTSYQNVSAITGYVWKKGISVISGATSSSYTIPIADYNSTTTNTYSCTITGTINNVEGATLTDTITVPMLLDGSSTPTVVLSNENMTFPASNIGFSGINFASGSCEVTAYIGATQLTYSATGGANTFKCTVSATNVTVAGGTISGTKLILPAPTAMSADSAYLDISTTIYDSTGTALSGLLVSRVTYALSRAGIKGDTGDAVDFIFVRSALQPATPAASAGVPSSPVQWYTDVASVPSGINPLWSSVGFKATGGTNYTWDTPSRIEGANVAEVSVYTRGVPTTTPSGGTYTFGSATPITSVPTSTGATWSADIPTGTSPVYISRAVVSAPAGNTSAVNITGWSTPVISFQNGVDTTSYWISCTDSLKRSTSLVYTPTTVSMTAYSKTGTANPSVYAGRFKVYENGSLTPSYTSATDQSTYAYTPSANNLTQLKVEVYLAGGTTTKLDEQTIPILQDGSSAISIVDSNNNVTIPTASDGSSSGTYPNSGTTIQVFEGATALTYTTGVATSGKFSVAVSQNPTSSITLGTTSGNNTTSFIIGNHSNMVTGTNSVSIVFTITAVKSDGTSITLTENQTITKAKAGVPSYTWTKYATDAFGTGLTDSPTGMSYIGIASNQSSPTESTNPAFYTWSKILGDTGLAGTSVYTATIYYQPNPASTPSAPSGGTYVFNGNTLTAPSPWSKTMPAASQTLPTYQCQFTFVTNPPTTTINSTLTAGTWSSPTVVSQLGTNGSSGSTAVRVYLKNSSSSAASSNPSGNITATGSSNDTWYTNTQTLTTGQFQWQCDGTYNPNTTSTTWGSPYLTVFKVDTLSAFTVNTGALTVNNALTVSTGGVIKSGMTNFATGTGYWLDYNSGTPRFSIGTGSAGTMTTGLSWDGGTAKFFGGGTFSGALSAASGTFAGSLSAATGSFAGSLSAATGSFGGTVTVGSSPAVSGNTMTGRGAVLNSNGTFAIGDSTANISFNGSTFTFNGNVVGTTNIQTKAVTEVTPYSYSTSFAASGPSSTLTSSITVPSSPVDTKRTLILNLNYNHSDTTPGYMKLTVGTKTFDFDVLARSGGGGSILGGVSYTISIDVPANATSVTLPVIISCMGTNWSSALVYISATLLLLTGKK